MKPMHHYHAPDISGFAIRIVQPRPSNYLAIIETDFGEELGRSSEPHQNPQAALSQALASIAAYRQQEGA